MAENETSDKANPTRDEIMKQARELFLDVKFNCAETVMLALTRGLELNAPPEVLRSVTPLGAGIGRSGGTCGALSAGAIVLGLLYGRNDPNEDRARSYQPAKAYRDRFEQAMGSTLCSDLNFMDFTSPEHRPRCAKIVTTAAGLLFDVIQEADQTT